jgi:hypothetical protein
VPSQDLGLPDAHGAGQAGQLEELHAVAPAVEAVQGGPGARQITGGIDRPQQFLALPGGGDLAETITGVRPAQPRSATAGELLGGGHQQLADPVQRIVLAAAVTEEGLLGPPADLIDHRVGQLDGVEVVHDHPGVAQQGDQGAGVAAPGVQRKCLPTPASQDRGRAPSQAATALVVRSAMTSRSRPPRMWSGRASGQQRGSNRPS